MPTNVVVSAQFNRDAHKLQKRYPHVFNDIAALRETLLAGHLPGKRLQNLPFRVYKTRIKNTDARRGKSGGYRVVYYLETEAQVVLITVYTKTDKDDLPIVVIRHLVEEYRQRG